MSEVTWILVETLRHNEQIDLNVRLAAEMKQPEMLDGLSRCTAASFTDIGLWSVKAVT